MHPVVHLPGEGEHEKPSSATIKATGEDTAGSFYLGEGVLEPGFMGRLLTPTSGYTTCSTSSRAH